LHCRHDVNVRDGNQRRAPARSILAGVKAIGAESVSYIEAAPLGWNEKPPPIQGVLVFKPLLVAKGCIERRRDICGPAD
jgi:hypothetical protein